MGRLNLDLVCLHATERGLVLEPEGTGASVDLAEEPNAVVAADLAQHKVSVGHYAVVKHFLKQDVPRGWRRCPGLRYSRAAVFLQGVCRLNGTRFVLRLSRELGLQIEKEAK